MYRPRPLVLSLVWLCCYLPISSGQARPTVAPETLLANLPFQPIGANDLVGVMVYNEPEMAGTLRVSSDGFIRFPMLKHGVKAQGLLPGELEIAVAEALRGEHILVDPSVKITVAEYKSHPIFVAGAVNQPVTFDAAGPVTLLEAVTRAGGLSQDAGPEILVTRTQPGADGTGPFAVQRIPVKGLINAADPALNLVLNGGEEIRVPGKGRIYVIGNVKMGGAFPMDDTESSVLKMLASAQGIMPYAAKAAYIYRQDANGKRNEVLIPLGKILERKAPDAQLLANDILFVPDNKGRRMTMEALNKILSLSSGAGAAAVYSLR